MKNNRFVTFKNLQDFYKNLAANDNSFWNLKNLTKKISGVSSNNSFKVSNIELKLKDSFELTVVYTDDNDEEQTKVFTINCSDITNLNNLVTTYDWLKFTAKTNNCSVILSEIGEASLIDLLYSLDGKSWGVYFPGNTIKLKKDLVLYFKAGTVDNTETGKNKSFSTKTDYYKFIVNGNVEISGNFISLLDATCSLTSIPTRYCFNGLFSGVKLLTEFIIPEIELKPYCFNKLFSGCSNLENVVVSFTEWTDATTDWLENVAAEGKIKGDGALVVENPSNSTVPEGWIVKKGPEYVSTGLLHWFDSVDGLEKTALGDEYTGWNDMVEGGTHKLDVVTITDDDPLIGAPVKLKNGHPYINIIAQLVKYEFGISMPDSDFPTSCIMWSNQDLISGEELPISNKNLFLDTKTMEIVCKPIIVDITEAINSLSGGSFSEYKIGSYGFNYTVNGYYGMLGFELEWVNGQGGYLYEGYDVDKVFESNYTEQIITFTNIFDFNNSSVDVYVNGKFLFTDYLSENEYGDDNLTIPGSDDYPTGYTYSLRLYDHELTLEEMAINHLIDVERYGNES